MSSGSSARIVHASTSFVDRFRTKTADVSHTPRLGIAAYIKAKTLTEIFAYELDRRMRAAGSPVQSLVAKPGVGVDAKTPERAGVRDAATPYQANPYTPWAHGKDSAAWPGVRALTDPGAQGGQTYAPAGGARGLPVAVNAAAHTSEIDPQRARSVWADLEQLAGVTLPA